MDLQNFPRATHMTNKWPQSNKLFSLRNETSCTKITRGFPFLGCKKQSLHFSLCGQLLCIICFEAKLSPLEQFVVYPLTTFFGRSSNFQTSVLMFNHNCLTWFRFGTQQYKVDSLKSHKILVQFQSMVHGVHHDDFNRKPESKYELKPCSYLGTTKLKFWCLKTLIKLRKLKFWCPKTITWLKNSYRDSGLRLKVHQDLVRL